MANEVVTGTRKQKRPKPKPREDEELLDSEGEERSRTKPQFNEVLQEAYLEHTQNDGKKKKKTKTDKTKSMTNEETGPLLKSKLESLKKGDGIRKDKEDVMLLANTYDPDDDPKNAKKSNKRRQRENQKLQNGVDNDGYNEDNELQQRKTKKKPQKNNEDDKNDKTMTIEELAPPIKKREASRESTKRSTSRSHKSGSPDGKSSKSQSAQENNRRPRPTPSKNADPEETSRKSRSPARKDKKNRQSPEPETSPVPPQRRKNKAKAKTAEQVLSEGGETVDEDQDHTKITSDPEESGQNKTKKKRKKKKKVTEELPPEIEDHGRIVSLCIHRTDKLKTDFLISHPVVRVSVVDESTGNYLKKQHTNRHVTSYYEGDNVDFVQPIMTQPFDFKQNKSTLPVWEEMLIFNENYDYLVQADPKVIVFFEVLDFMSMNAASHKYTLPSNDGGWHRIAWGFFKVLGANGKPNSDKKIRLQLYQPPVRFRTTGSQLQVYQWWKSTTRFPYPSTLYITLKGIIPPETIEPAQRSMFATQEEKGRVTYDDLQKTLDGGTSKRDARGRGPSLWTRLAGQLCKIPNSLYMNLPSGKKGCHVVRFSPDGKSLACGCHDKDGYPILVYEIPSGKLKGHLNGHYSIIYDLCWAKNNLQLLSASADGTARIWDTDRMSNTAVKTFPHPSFVYSARYHVRVDRIVVTGGYDRMIRVWTTKSNDVHALLLQELDGHLSYVNTICFDLEGLTMYSGDSLGQIKVWSVHVTDKPSSNGFLKEWSHHKDITDTETEGVAINCLKMHPSGRRLLIHPRNNILRLYDLRIGATMQRYNGALNFREHLRSTFTTCGSFVLTGSEDACAYVWNVDTGDQVASYKELGYRQPVSDVDFHPHEHMVAFCSFGENHQVLVYKYDHKVAQRDAGLETFPPDLSTKKGRPMSPEMRPGADLKTEEEEALETVRSRAGTVDLNLEHSSRMDRARRKLDSVLTFAAGSSFRPVSPSHPLAVPRDGSPLPPGLGTTWGSTFDASGLYTQGTRGPDPSSFSPHASRDMASAAISQQQLATQTDFMRQSHNTWRPGFTGVGRHGTPTPRGPNISMNMSQGKPQLQIMGSKKALDWVVAMYDYHKQRSDELSFTRGDMMAVICKDTENWWLAQSPTGEEGYIPANYFTTQGAEEKEPHSHVAAEKHDTDEEDKRSRTTAVISQSGELKFISGTEDSDVESSARRRRRNRKSLSSRNTTLSLEDETEQRPTHVHRKKRTTHESESKA